MKKILAGLGAALVVIGLAACAPVEGTVVEKTYKPDESGYGYGYGYVNGKYGYGYVYTSDPECYGIHVRTDEGKISSTCVSASEWESLEIGDYRDVQ